MKSMPHVTDCDRIRELLWPLDAPRVAGEDEAEAQAHLASCPECQAFFQHDAALSRALRRVDEPSQAPSGLTSRVQSALDREPRQLGRRAAGRRRSASLAAPLAAAAAVLLAVVGLLRISPQDLDALYVESYLERDAEELVLASPDGDQAYEFFMRELGVPMSPVLFGEGRLNRAMICLIEGRRTAMVEYELDGHMVAHYRGPISSEDGGGAMHSATEDGVCVVRWSDGEFSHALVADIPEDELRVIAVQQFAALR